MRLAINNKVLLKEFKNKGVLYTSEYIITLKEKLKESSNTNTTIPNEAFKVPNIDDNRSFFSKVFDIFSVKTHIKSKISNDFDGSISIALNKKIQEMHPILGININDPIIDNSYIENCLVDIKPLLDQISPEYIDTEHQNLILNDYRQHLRDMYKALNDEKVDVEFIKDSFKKLYSINEKYNGQLRDQKIRHDILMFQQAFNMNPEKFKNIEDLIPVNLGTLVDVFGCSEPNIICHSIGGIVTGDSLKYAHEILISRAFSAKFNTKLFVKLDQNDAEVISVLSFFSKIGNLEKGQLNTDVFLLDEDNMTFSDWDIKNEYLKIVVPRKFAQQIVQLGNFYDDSIKEDFNNNYIYELLRDFEKKIKSPQTTVEQKAFLIKRHTELTSYLFSKDPVLLLPSGDKNFFYSVKMFLDLSSYFKK